MEKYYGIPCPICNKEFLQNDDIVVCPDCGAPHHRTCYKEHGRCAFDEQHVQGTEWKNPNTMAPVGPAVAEGATIHCPRCNTVNSAGNHFCDACGARLTAEGSTQPQPVEIPDYKRNYKQNNGYNNVAIEDRSVRIDDKLGGIPVKEVAQFVGENALYYLPRFKLLELQKNIPSINISAMVFTFFYYFHRKMYKLGAAMLGLFLLSVLPQLLLAYYAFPDIIMNGTLTQASASESFLAYPNLLLMSNVFHYLFLFASMASGFFANKLYFRFVLDHITKIKEKYQSRPEPEYAKALAINGRTNKLVVVLVLAMFFVAFMLFSMVLAYVVL